MPSPRPSNHHATSTTIIITITLSTAATLLISKIYYKRKNNKIISKLTELRLAERRGRIRAEIELRSTEKQQQLQHQQQNDSHQNDMTLQCIGTIITPFPKRMGTARQSQLVPHSRAFVKLTVPIQTISGMEEYSHCWIIFGFHANTDLPKSSRKTKIKPPRAGGLKIGQMATRSPHRPNPIGLSLVRIRAVDTKNKRLLLEGIDIVNGSPVYDIKPCVPWDIPGYFDKSSLQVPPWVTNQDDTIQNVTFTPTAHESLYQNFINGNISPLYDAKKDDDFESAINAIREILVQDPRAANKRGSTEMIIPYKILFCQVQLEFVAKKDSDILEVISVNELELDSFKCVDGVPIIMEKKKVMSSNDGEKAITFT